MADFYEVLGVPRTADQDEIQRAYRKLARAHHPDVNKDPGAEARFKEISEAYAVLSDPDTRRRYDAFGEDFRRVPEDADPRAWARQGAGRARSDRFQDVDLDDILGGMFGRRGFGSVPGADQEAEVELTVEEAYRGARRSITFDGGRTIEANIPAGVSDGQRIRLAGQGGRGAGGGPAGDLYLIVRIAAHPRYRVDGRDLFVDLPLAPWEAALGTSVPLDTPGGETKVTVPSGSSSGRRLRLRGRGLPNPRGRPGDLYAEVKIMVPDQLSAQERRLFEELAAVARFDPRTARRSR
jgi:curved DNA-binding protein